MKTKYIVLIIVLFLFLIITIKEISKYRFGHFIDGPEMKYEHRYADILKLDNGNILILGQNAHSCLKADDCEGGIVKIYEIPSEIYLSKENRFINLTLPSDIIAYKSKGLLLNNNKLLLTYAHNLNNKNYSKIEKLSTLTKNLKKPYTYDSMAIVDLKTKKVENIIQKKIDKDNIPDATRTMFALLDNDKVLIVEAIENNRTLIEIYNPQTNTSELLNDLSTDSLIQAVIPTKANSALLFDNTGYIYKYSDANKTTAQTGKTQCQGLRDVKKISENEILLIGGIDDCIEKYNIDTNSTKIISKNQYNHRFTGKTFSAEKIYKDYLLIAGGNYRGTFTKYYRDTSIINLKTNKIYKGQKLPIEVSEAKMLPIGSDKVIILDNKINKLAKKTLIFEK